MVYDLLMKAAAETTLAIAPHPSASAPTRLPPTRNGRRTSHRTRRAPCAAHARVAVARMIVIEVFARGCEPRWRPTPTANDTS